MKPKYAAIDLADYYALLTVWELEDGYRELLTITRLRCAIALARESPLTRLIFPAEVKPNGVWGGVCKKHTLKTNPKKVDSLQKRQEKVLALLKATPGQTREVIASLLEVSVATVLQLLRKLEKENEIHYRPHPQKHKTRLYYVGASPTTISTAVTSSRSRTVPRLLKQPPLKVYFVDPRTLHSVNK